MLLEKKLPLTDVNLHPGDGQKPDGQENEPDQALQ